MPSGAGLPFLIRAAYFQSMRTTITRSLPPGRHALVAILAVSALPTPAQYCEPDGFSLGVEPICRLMFADIDNASPGTSSAPAYEDFTSLVAHLERGATYTVTASGYTGNTPPDHLAANFDWDGDYTFETHVELADITGDNCDTQTSGSFTVPADAAIGASRVRFVKTFSYYADDTGCQWGSSYGQAEDYTVEVALPTGIAERNSRVFTVAPNPGNGDITLWVGSDGTASDITVLDLSGRIVHRERAVPASGAPLRLDLSSTLSPGTYTVQVRQGGLERSARFVVQ